VEADRPTVSCVIPVRDAEAFLGEALDSVLAQTRPPQEVIVVDDSSSDRSARIAEAYGAPVRVLAGRHRGPAAARQQGIEAATGDLLSFLDADDTWLPEKQERQLERLAARPDLEMSLCQCEMFWEDGLGDEEERYRAIGRHRGAYLFQTMLVWRSVFDRIGPLDPARIYGDNVDWLARAADAGVVTEVLDEVLVSRRMHAGSLTHVDPSLESYVDVVKAHLDRRRAAGRGVTSRA
jgi:glycosyltransferase involved in cell wall biosynthesis